MSRLEWRYYLPEEAPKLRLQKRPLANSAGHPAYCSDALTWHKRTWTAPKLQQDLFNVISDGFYSMLYKTLARGVPLEITPMQVRQQIAGTYQAYTQRSRGFGVPSMGDGPAGSMVIMKKCSQPSICWNPS